MTSLSSYRSPKTIIKNSPIHGVGLFAKNKIKKHEIVTIKIGHIINSKILQENKGIIKNTELQIADNFFIAPLRKSEYKRFNCFINHSCNPNCGIEGNIITVALRNIMAGEELTVDYATERSGNDFKLQCNCKSRNCRQIITGNDWKLQNLQKKYKGYFSLYLQKKIDSK